jgi:hypothetical protein
MVSLFLKFCNFQNVLRWYVHVMHINRQTFYSIVNNFVSIVVQHGIHMTELKLSMCHCNLMLCSSSIPFEP